MSISSWDWFKKYEHEMIKKRGDEYEGLKKTLGHQMIEQGGNSKASITSFE